MKQDESLKSIKKKSRSGWIDVHSHLADPRIIDHLQDWIEAAKSRGVTRFIQGGIGPEDWSCQRKLAQRFPDQIGLCFGLHPYWVAQHSEEENEHALDLLAQQISEALLLGECGLDFRPEWGKSDSDREKQMRFFELQLELALVCQKPFVLHLVRAHPEALKILDEFRRSDQRGFVHSFNGSWGQAQDFLKRNLLISVGGPVARRQNQKLQEAVKKIPLEFLLIETDSPDQPGDLFKHSLHPLEGLFEVARVVGEIKGVGPLEVLDISASNFKRLLGNACPWS